MCLPAKATKLSSSCRIHFMLNHKEVAFLLGITPEKLPELVEHGLRLPVSKAIAKLEVTSVHGDICVSDEQLDKFISAFEAEEPGRHPPVTVRRELLTEANHRCGICRSPVARLQFHHMVEWSKVPHHDPKHMIAICGTCHDNCGIGVIDKKAQEMYKTRLQQPHYVTSKTCESVTAPTAPEQQRATLVPSEVRLPGFSFHMMIRINNIPGARRKYIFDMGSASAERLSIYISSDNILTFQFVDAKHEVHPLQLPFGSAGPSIGKFAYLTCELGISGSTTELRLYCDGERIGEQILQFKTDIGSLDLPNAVLGADLNGSDGASFDIRDLAVYTATFTTENLETLAGYFDSRRAEDIPYVEFGGKQWMRVSKLPPEANSGPYQNELAPRYRIPERGPESSTSATPSPPQTQPAPPPKTQP